MRITVRRAGGSVGSVAVYLDGIQLEQGPLTTYLDGDMDDCVWLGRPHRSVSYRPATTRSGGTMYPLAGLRAYPTGHAGVGMAPITNLVIDRSDLDGALYQRTRSPERTLTITTSIVGTSLVDLHAVRRRLIDVIKPNATPDPQPLLLMYTGAGEGKELVLPIHYTGGLDVTDMDVVADAAALQFAAYDPIWRDYGHQGTRLGLWTDIGVVQGVVWRDPQGRWGKLSGAGSTPFGTSPIIYHVNADRTGTLIVCGAFDRIDNGTVNRIAMLASGTWYSLLGTNGSIGLPGGTPYVTMWSADREYLYVGGRFWNIAGGGGTALARWNRHTSGTIGTWHVISGLGTAVSPVGGSAIVYDLKPHANGSILVLGNFWINFRQGAAWMYYSEFFDPSIIDVGPTGTYIMHRAYRMGPHQFLVLGSFVNPGGTPGGTHIASLSVRESIPTWGTYRWQPASPLGGGVVTQSGEIYVTVSDGIAGSRGYFRVRRGGATRLTGQSWGAAFHMPPIEIGHPICETRDGRLVMLAGTLPAIGDRDGRLWIGNIQYHVLTIAEYTNGGWAPDMLLKFHAWGTNIPYGITQSADGTIYVWGHIWFNAIRASHQIIVNTASHDVYPLMTWTNGRITAIINRTTGDGIYGDLSTAYDERAYIDTRPDRARVWSDMQGNITSSLLPTSKLAGFRLVPGTNYLQVHASNYVLIWWTPRYWSFDG